ncbi:hypothetical protein QFC21_003075 [Naganishia friedmannii]|uniref:Uncharacterized protein n=1 Tax=Naganishia friedmannii TaxID=89922 RepID=A0ACC2VRI5_9TREE|nr:hypothetical protein QFC21_003075 [Naganishia friedmannii]
MSSSSLAITLLLLLCSYPAQAALQHRPIAHHPSDMHAAPRFEFKFLNEYPVSRVEAEGWTRLLAAGGGGGGGADGGQEEAKHAIQHAQSQSNTNSRSNPREETTPEYDLDLALEHVTSPPTSTTTKTWQQLFDGSTPTPPGWDWTRPSLSLSRGTGIQHLHQHQHANSNHRPLTGDPLPRLIKLRLPAVREPSSSAGLGVGSGSGPGLEEWLCLIPPLSTLHLGPDADPASSSSSDNELIENDSLPPTTAADKETAADKQEKQDKKDKEDKQLAVSSAREAKTAQATQAATQADPLQQTLQALDHLRGTCLFHRAGWFTYAYCHASHVRQFREIAVVDPAGAAAGRGEGWVPGEDPTHEAFDLGVSPAEIRHRLEYHSDLTNSRGLENDPQLELQLAAYEYALSEFYHAQSRAGQAASGGMEDQVGEVELVQNSQGRYLVQRWSGGTVCDMTGRPRRIEIQFHCRMGGVDEISSIKEIATCQYLMTIHSPHLCSLPGFHIPTIDDEPSRPIICREIRDDDDVDQYDQQLATTSGKPHESDGRKAKTHAHDGQAFPRGYPAQPHGAQWLAHTHGDGGRVIYEPTKGAADDPWSSSSSSPSPPHVVVVDPAPVKKRKSAKAAHADTLDEESRKTWLAEQRALNIAGRETRAKMQEKLARARREVWDSRWDVRFVKRFGWVLGVDEDEYREWWEALLDEAEEEMEREREERKMMV